LGCCLFFTPTYCSLAGFAVLGSHFPPTGQSPPVFTPGGRSVGICRFLSFFPAGPAPQLHALSNSHYGLRVRGWEIERGSGGGSTTISWVVRLVSYPPPPRTLFHLSATAPLWKIGCLPFRVVCCAAGTAGSCILMRI